MKPARLDFKLCEGDMNPYKLRFPYDLTGAIVTMKVASRTASLFVLTNQNAGLIVAANTPVAGKSEVTFRQITEVEEDTIKALPGKTAFWNLKIKFAGEAQPRSFFQGLLEIDEDEIV
jgi:hypothetical protein